MHNELSWNRVYMSSVYFTCVTCFSYFGGGGSLSLVSWPMTLNYLGGGGGGSLVACFMTHDLKLLGGGGGGGVLLLVSWPMTLNYFVVYQGMVELGFFFFWFVVVVIAGVVVLFVVVGVAVGVVVVFVFDGVAVGVVVGVVVAVTELAVCWPRHHRTLVFCELVLLLLVWLLVSLSWLCVDLDIMGPLFSVSCCSCCWYGCWCD